MSGLARRQENASSEKIVTESDHEHLHLLELQRQSPVSLVQLSG
jgi:hypothetical protein